MPQGFSLSLIQFAIYTITDIIQEWHIKTSGSSGSGAVNKDLLALPILVRKFFGHALDFAQRGHQHDAAMVFKGFGGAGVLEVVEDEAGGTCRAVYTVKFEKTVFVLHCFQKKSKRGIATPSADRDIIRARLKIAEALAQELRHGNTQD